MEVRYGRHGFRVYVYNLDWIKWVFALFVAVYWRGEITALLQVYAASFKRCSFPVVDSHDQSQGVHWIFTAVLHWYYITLKALIHLLYYFRWS